MYDSIVKFEWDETKNRSNFNKHGVNFNDATEIFSSTRVTTVDNRKDYGEIRKITIGRIDKRICIAVYAERDETIRIISARKANARERRKYDEFIEGTANEEARRDQR